MSVAEFEAMMEDRSPTIEDELPDDSEEPFWSDFQQTEDWDSVRKARREKAVKRAEAHLHWKGSQEKAPENRNYYGPDNDAEGVLNW